MELVKISNRYNVLQAELGMMSNLIQMPWGHKIECTEFCMTRKTQKNSFPNTQYWLVEDQLFTIIDGSVSGIGQLSTDSIDSIYSILRSLLDELIQTTD